MAAMERKLRCGGRSTMMLCLWWLMGGAFANVVTREHPEEPKIDKLNGRPNIDANELIGGHPYAEEFRRSAGYVKESHPPYGNNGYGGSPPPPPYGNRPMCEFNGPYPEPYHHQEHHGHYYGGHKSNGYNDNYGYVKQKNYGLPGYGHHKKHSTYGGDNSYSNNHHHLSNYEYGGGGGAHYGNNYGGENGGYGNEGGYDYHHHNSDTNVYDVVGKSKETVEDVYDQKALKHNHYQVDRSDLIYPLHIPHSKSSYESDYGGSSPTASYDQPYAYSGQGVYGGDMYQKPSPYSDNAYSGAPNAGDYTGSPVRTSLLTPQVNLPPPPPLGTTTTTVPVTTTTDARTTTAAATTAAVMDTTTTELNDSAAATTMTTAMDALPEPGPQTECGSGAFAAVDNCSAFFRCAMDTAPDAPLSICWLPTKDASMVFDDVAGKCLRFDALSECSNLEKLCSQPAQTPWRIVGKRCLKVALNCDNQPPTICSADTEDFVDEFGRCVPPSEECRQMMQNTLPAAERLIVESKQ